MEQHKINEIQKAHRSILKSRIQVSTEGKPGYNNSPREASEPIARVARRTSVNKKHGILLYSITRHLNPAMIVELGTSCGTSAMYLASGQSKGMLYTLEGWPSLAKESQDILEKAGFRDVEVVTGQFSDTLPRLLSRVPKIDLLYLDGDHTLEGTLHYFEMCLEKIHSGSVFVLDDIHWSSDMEKAWNIVRQHERVSLSIDIFRMGILLFKKDIAKQHYSIRY